MIISRITSKYWHYVQNVLIRIFLRGQFFYFKFMFMVLFILNFRIIKYLLHHVPFSFRISRTICSFHGFSSFFSFSAVTNSGRVILMNGIHYEGEKGIDVLDYGKKNGKKGKTLGRCEKNLIQSKETLNKILYIKFLT